jgi:hypothetical protein
LGIGLVTRLLFPNMKGMSPEITEELIARQTPEALAIIRVLLVLFSVLFAAGKAETSRGIPAGTLSGRFHELLALLPFPVVLRNYTLVTPDP